MMSNVFLLDETPEPAKIVGGKASNIMEMFSMGLPVAEGFVIPTNWTFEKDFTDPDAGYTFAELGFLSGYIRYLADRYNKTWCSEWGEPLLVSVRSGAPISMPGMMDTILNVGLTRDNLDRFVESMGATKAFGLDCYRRLIQMYAITVDGVEPSKFNSLYEAAQTFYLGQFDENAYQTLVDFYEKVYLEETGRKFTDDPNEQLIGAINAVFRSWHSEKARTYREIENISHTMGTAVTVQRMIFGNLDNSATGVAFSHDPNTGERGIYGDFLLSAQGEDVVAGTHKVSPINDLLKNKDFKESSKQLQGYMAKLFQRHHDMLDVEFTIERGKLYILQYRIAKRSQKASVRMLLDMVRDGTLPTSKATTRFLEMLPTVKAGVDDPGNLTYVGKGIGATDGTVVGKIAVGHKMADRYAEQGVDYIYVAEETAPEDSAQMKNSVGILTALGGKLSHAAVVARGWNKSCVVSLPNLEIMEDDKGIIINGQSYENGCLIKIDGSTGEVWA